MRKLYLKSTAMAVIAAFATAVLAPPVMAEIGQLQQKLNQNQVQDAAKKPNAQSVSAGAPNAAAQSAKAPGGINDEMSLDNLQKLNKLLVEIGRYEPKVYEIPAAGNSVSRAFRKLTGNMSIDDYMAEGYAEFQKGNFSAGMKSFKAILDKDPWNDKALYYFILCKMGYGNVKDATKIAEYLRNKVRDKAWEKMFKKSTDPWVEAEVAFKIGGFDSLDDYKKKIAAGNRKELHGDEYYEKYVDKNTWKFKSKAAEKEFQSIAGIDCGGFVQRVYMDLCKKNGIEPPFNSKLPGSQLTSSKYAKQVKADGMIPPLSAKPGDFMTLSNHDGWGHVFMFAGRDKDGRPLIVEASGEGKVLARPMPDRYFARYEGTYSFNNMDKIREKMLAESVTARAN